MKTIRISTTDYALLGMLEVEPMSGYQIRKEIEGSIAYFWTESYGQIYPALRRLSAENLIEPVHRKGKERAKARVFSLTPRGRAALAEWLARSPEPQPPRNQLLLKLFFGHAATPAVCLKHVTDVRERTNQRLLAYSRLRQEIGLQRAGHPDLPYWLMTLAHGESQAQAQLRWCDESIAELVRLEKRPAKMSKASRGK